ncbi:hypothetical protein GOBAR_AA26814 [Gossypium barbadense]|uniref:Uncharacterized protein n=1 Tax=Gossypium barbadense TaxID=3634 RepID=A0A2P5WRZ4_GOSBA|nr:hypothetical protein GOBAR_AA26814 [Gossypium barbadense]
MALRWKVEQSSNVSSRYVGSTISKKSPHGSVVRRAWTASASWIYSRVVQSIQRPTPRGRTRSIWNSSSRGPGGNWRNGCRILVVGIEEDAVLFCFSRVKNARKKTESGGRRRFDGAWRSEEVRGNGGKERRIMYRERSTREGFDVYRGKGRRKSGFWGDDRSLGGDGGGGRGI